MKVSTDVIFRGLFARHADLLEIQSDIRAAVEALTTAYRHGGKLLVCGNGGSAADSEHIVGELMKGFLKKRPFSPEEKERFGDSEMAENLQKGLPAISLCAHSALMTAFENDAVPALVFAQQVCAYAAKNDLLMAFTTSGNSANVVYALKAAKAAGVGSVAVTGERESESSRLADVCIRLPETETFKVQELTLPVYHCLAAMIEDKYFEI